MMNIPIPYTPKVDDGIAIILLCCFFISAFVLAKTKKYLWLQGKSFILHKDRNSIFASVPATDLHLLMLLVIQTCILSSTCFFNYFDNKIPLLVQHVHPYYLLGIYVVITFLYLIFKWAMYSFLGWIFGDKGTTDQWLESYSTLVYYLGFALFPFVLLSVYFDLKVDVMVVFGLIFIFLAKLLLFYKALKFFFNNINSLVPLILYFCALEIIPCLIYYQVLIKINSLVLLKI